MDKEEKRSKFQDLVAQVGDLPVTVLAAPNWYSIAEELRKRVLQLEAALEFASQKLNIDMGDGEPTFQCCNAVCGHCNCIVGNALNDEPSPILSRHLPEFRRRQWVQDPNEMAAAKAFLEKHDESIPEPWFTATYTLLAEYRRKEVCPDSAIEGPTRESLLQMIEDRIAWFKQVGKSECYSSDKAYWGPMVEYGTMALESFMDEVTGHWPSRAATAEDTLTRARDFAMSVHGDQKYGNEPYVVHLDEVAALAEPYGIAAKVVAYLHDTIEDTRFRTKAEVFADVATKFGKNVALAVQGLSDEPGETRKERKAKTYARMSLITIDDIWGRIVLIVKAADRLANARRCVKDQSSLLDMYRKEQPQFRKAVYRSGVNDELMVEIDKLLG